MKKQRKRCRCLDCKGMGFTIQLDLYTYQYKETYDTTVSCQSCLGCGWLWEKDFKEQIKHSNLNNLEIIEVYEEAK